MTATDATIASVGMPSHPQPHDIAKGLRELATDLEQHGLDVIDMLHNLAARGYPPATLGDGGSRGSSLDTSTDRAVLGRMTEEDVPAPLVSSRWHGADYRYSLMLHDLWRLIGNVKAENDEVRRHGSDDDPTPAGTGECMACGRFCRPTKDRPGHRLVSGLCRASCYPAWLRAEQPQRGTWIAERKRSFTDDAGLLHTPEPDADIDLSHELPVSSA